MVKIRQHYHDEESGHIEANKWLEHAREKKSKTEFALIERAFHVSQISGHDQATFSGESCAQQGLAIADILLELSLDAESIASALILPLIQQANLSLEDITEQLNPRVAKLIRGVMQMDDIRELHQQQLEKQQATQIDNLRKMLLAMVDDVRVVLIKLAERLSVMRTMQHFTKTQQTEIAREIQDIYAPLANRLGLGQIKWELEDLAFRYLKPDIYKDIVKSIDQKRTDRQVYVNQIIDELNQQLTTHGLHHFEVTGRAKHVYSIYRKMDRKDVDFSQIYDALAVRIIVENLDDCYTALGVAHSLWQSIPSEFDDYINHPKPNGYRSLHTAVVGPDGRNVEVQIRTQEMHQESELGVAAHWLYKEGGARSSYDQKIAWLRQIIDWQKEVSGEEKNTEQPETKIFEDRVYVFTPNNEIIDLPNGATPLDFAYLIHTSIGHRCRGAKINNAIVPITYQLKTGDRIEILTAKEPSPSRDWLNPSLHYLATSRARAKVLHWFKEQDYDRNRHDGHEILLRELKRLGTEQISLEDIAEKFPQKNIDDFYAAIGAGDIRLGQIIHQIELLDKKQSVDLDTAIIKKQTSTRYAKGINIDGVGNLLTLIAKCCHPVQGDPIIGFITLGKGVSIHRQDCSNVLTPSAQHPERVIQVSWGEEKNLYPVDIMIDAYDRHGLVRDISTLLAAEKVNLTALTTQVDKTENIAHIQMTIEITNLTSLSQILSKVSQMPNVIKVERKK